LDEITDTKHSAPGIETLATIIVGEEKKRLAVCEVLLTHYSEFFRAALNAGFKEAEEKCVKLEEDSIFIEIFVYWLYYQSFPTHICGQLGKWIEGWMNDPNPKADLFVHLYILSDKYSIRELGKEALDAAFIAFSNDKHAHPLRPSTIRRAFDCLDHKSVMCRFIIESCAFWGDEGEFKTPDYYDCVSFVAGLVCRLLEMTVTYITAKYHLCQLHEHTTETEK
jgi:hypothetical protein